MENENYCSLGDGQRFVGSRDRDSDFSHTSAENCILFLIETLIKRLFVSWWYCVCSQFVNAYTEGHKQRHVNYKWRLLTWSLNCLGLTPLWFILSLHWCFCLFFIDVFVWCVFLHVLAMMLMGIMVTIYQTTFQAALNVITAFVTVDPRVTSIMWYGLFRAATDMLKRATFLESHKKWIVNKTTTGTARLRPR